ncbi:MAG TPA: SCO family protein [Xanthomonadales bacterium]|nr:SCO family protein [Xanthomonadales bacterium]
MTLARLLVLAVLAVALSPAASASELVAGVFEPPRTAPGFTLAGSHGEPLELAKYRGKVVVLGFGFTNCTSVCPITLATLAAAMKELGAAAHDVQVLYVTVDPERDTAERMKAYLNAFDPSFRGGTGTEEQLAAVRREYGIMAEKHAGPGNYQYGHSSFTYLIDREGKLRALMTYGHAARDYVHDLRALLAQP